MMLMGAAGIVAVAVGVPLGAYVAAVMFAFTAWLIWMRLCQLACDRGPAGDVRLSLLSVIMLPVMIVLPVGLVVAGFLGVRELRRAHCAAGEWEWSDVAVDPS